MQGIFQKENTDKALKYGIYRHLPTYEKIIRNLVSFYEIKIPIPDIKIQQSIVDVYNAYITRKQINERLKQQIKDICPILIAGAIKEANANA